MLTCETKNGVCAKCYGRDLARGTPVNMGEAVGVIAAQSIGEPGTQLTMRTFHIGGTAQVVDQSTIESNFDGTVQDPQPQRGAELGRPAHRHGPQHADRHRRPRRQPSARSTASPTARACWSTRATRSSAASGSPSGIPTPVRSSPRSTASSPTRISSSASRSSETTDESTGITKRVVIDWRANPRGSDLKPAIVVKSKDGKTKKTARGGDARYLLPVDAILSVEPGAEVKAGDVLARIPMESAKTRDITGGLPRVAELFEARRPKDHAIIAEIDGTIRFGRDYKNKRRIILEPREEGAEAVEYLIPKGKPFHLQDGDTVEKGDYIVEGNPAPHDILAIKGIEELAAYLVNEIQEVYRLQGVTINDKHIEVIVRQMLQKVEITEPGDTDMFPGEQIDQLDLEQVNDKVIDGGQEAGARACRCSSASPRRACRRARSSRRRPSRRPPASSPRRRSRARSTRSKASRRTSSSAGSSRRAPAAWSAASARSPTHRDELILEERKRAVAADQARRRRGRARAGGRGGVAAPTPARRNEGAARVRPLFVAAARSLYGKINREPRSMASPNTEAITRARWAPVLLERTDAWAVQRARYETPKNHRTLER